MDYKDLIETCCFFLRSLGACALILTGTFVMCKLYKFLNDLSKDGNKKLIKDTIKEVEKNGSNKR